MNALRIYGKRPYSVAVLHGGPGAPGGMAPVARELSAEMGVIEPLQAAGTIDGQVAELAGVLEENADLPVTVIGWSWGATLGYIFAAYHPALVKKLILVAAPPFEEEDTAAIFARRTQRLGEKERIEVFSLEETLWKSGGEERRAAMARLFHLFAAADSFDSVSHPDEVLDYQFDINASVGLEVRQLTAGGGLLKLGAEIRCPVVAIHGDYDTHLPGDVKEPLARVLPDFRFILLEKCGHEPWAEKHAGEKFFRIVRKELGYGITGNK